jgi:hypothetical protein
MVSETNCGILSPVHSKDWNLNEQITFKVVDHFCFMSLNLNILRFYAEDIYLFLNFSVKKFVVDKINSFPANKSSKEIAVAYNLWIKIMLPFQISTRIVLILQNELKLNVVVRLIVKTSNSHSKVKKLSLIAFHMNHLYKIYLVKSSLISLQNMWLLRFIFLEIP